MRIAVLFFCCLIAASTCLSQTTDGAIYLYKKDGSPAKDIKSASYFMHIIMQNDTTYISRYYNVYGPMIRQESFRDSNFTIPNGRFCWYNNKGLLDSTGYVNNGRKDGSWEYKRSNTQTDMVTYNNGVVVKKETYLYDKDGKRILSGDTTKGEVSWHTQVAAKYKGGADDWVDYCQHNLNTPARLQNVLKAGRHTVIVCFLVNKQGSTDDIYLYQSCEWSGDAEVIRLIADSPKWQPAVQDGRPVLYRQKQSLTYQVINN
ncbi:hypothetical protein FC093_21415 [Ilyomonas limi]|uniref:TonB C-terminal domain-containing protein n=1 Tax=Ilyomonas limi TaxID=2575867 RepID=A0A4U3KV94_9BACT|nr:hypothetical protein [Ilyomonas limi]TKK64936.1 hypothetical protein FC093_21415 [Ilyomonas limi]